MFEATTEINHSVVVLNEGEDKALEHAASHRAAVEYALEESARMTEEIKANVKRGLN